MEEVMPFGKHKGRLLAEVPRGYLRWLVGQKWLQEPLKSAVASVLEEDPIPELQPPRVPWMPWSDLDHLKPEVEAQIHAVVRDAEYWMARLR